MKKWLLLVIGWCWIALSAAGQSFLMDQAVRYLNTVLYQQAVVLTESTIDSTQFAPPYLVTYQIDITPTYDLEIQVIRDNGKLLSRNIIDPRKLAHTQVFKTYDHDGILLNCIGDTYCIRKYDPAGNVRYYGQTMQLRLVQDKVIIQDIRNTFLWLIMQAAEYKDMRAQQ